MYGDHAHLTLLGCLSRMRIAVQKRGVVKAWCDGGAVFGLSAIRLHSDAVRISLGRRSGPIWARMHCEHLHKVYCDQQLNPVTQLFREATQVGYLWRQAVLCYSTSIINVPLRNLYGVYLYTDDRVCVDGHSVMWVRSRKAHSDGGGTSLPGDKWRREWTLENP